MKRAVTILWLLTAIFARGYSQLGALRGQLRYEHQYQDFLTEQGSFATELRQSPMVDVNLSGILLSPRLLTWSAFSSLSLNFHSSQSTFSTASGSQSAWDKYNFIFNVLPLAPVKLSLATRENALAARSNFNDEPGILTRARQQEYRADLSVFDVPWLPTTALSYIRNRSWDPIDRAFETVSQAFSFSMAGSSSPQGSVSLSGVYNDFDDRVGAVHDRFFTFDFSGARSISAGHRLSIHSEYKNYYGYSNLTGSVGYFGTLTDLFRISTGMSGYTASTSYAVYRSYGLSQSFMYRLPQFYQFGLRVYESASVSQFSLARGVRSVDGRGIGSALTASHNRTIGSMIVSNNIALSYDRLTYITQYSVLNGGWSNSIQARVGSYGVSGDYSLSFSRTMDGNSWMVVGNNAGLGADGIILQPVQSHSGLHYHEEHYIGDIESFRNQKNISLTQRFDGSFNQVIPFTLGFGASVNWYFAGIRGHTHGWNISFGSGSFFVPGLFASYVYSRTYDIYYQRELGEHTGSMSYHWRALSFEARFHYATYPLRVRDIVLTVTRPF